MFFKNMAVVKAGINILLMPASSVVRSEYAHQKGFVSCLLVWGATPTVA
ncbi:hypothetical protein [Arcanobacterium phocae]|nr:hypothetical protein [Arcanobacterium phocae]